MAVTENSYTGNGTNRDFIFTFSYLSPTHVKAKINGTVVTAFTLISASIVRFDTAPANGVSVVIYRETPSDNLLADYTPGSALRESDLELTLQQVLYVAQETQTFAENQSTTGLQAQITTANNNASNAVTTANAAASTAASAVSTANSANSTASGLAASISTANTNASTALTNANNAQSAATAAQTTAEAALNRNGGYKNKLINGAFNVNVRGTTSTATGWLTDRWFGTIVGSSCTFSTQSLALGGESPVPLSASRYLRASVTSVAGANNRVQLVNNIENVRTLQAQTFTVSFWAKASASTQIAANFTQRFGTGGSPSSDVNFGATKWNISTTWTRYSATITAPSIAGLTVGTNNNSTLQFSLWFDAGSNFNSQTNTLGQSSKLVDVACIQIEPGNTATTFEDRSFSEELELCQRYYELLPDCALVGYQLANQDFVVNIPFKVSKARVPTMGWTTLTATGTSSADARTTNTETFSHYARKDGTSGFIQWSSLVTADAEL